MNPILKYFAAIAVGVTLVGGLVYFNRPAAERGTTPPTKSEPDLPPPLSESLKPLPRANSPYLNTKASAKYVGNTACRTCHEEEFKSYSHTTHAHALSKTNPSHEPPDAEFFHKSSQRWYRVYRQADQLRHREFIRDDQDRELILNDHAVTWTIGSGQFSKSYLIDIDGFLIESPITWYAQDQKWGMSPGFQGEVHPGFQRLSDTGCLVCHSGRVTGTDGNNFQPNILQSSIGCESCHGPGSLHVARHESKTEPAEEHDRTIVNPAELDRSLSESICANCHLRGEATVVRRGLEINDFRPGLPLSDVRIDYATETPNGEMKVVGHMEQMWLSRCYTESQTLTCITCHDPHHSAESDNLRMKYRQACLDCHTESGCGLPKSTRLEKSKDDDCISCHMPKTDTDIPHLAFTHHRIAKQGSHQAPATSSDNQPAELKPWPDLSAFSQEERDRDLGLGYLEYADKQPHQFKNHLYHAGTLLEKGEPDSDCLAGLARVYWELQLSGSLPTANEALRAKSISSSARTNALVVRATQALKEGELQLAQTDLEELTRLKRHAGYWALLAEAHLRQNQIPEATAALEKAVQIAPDRVDLRRGLLNILLKQGATQKAKQQQSAIDVLSALKKDDP